MQDQLPTYITDDPRIGRKAHRADGRFHGVVEYVMRSPDGYELLSLRNGAMANGGLEPEQVIIDELDEEILDREGHTIHDRSRVEITSGLLHGEQGQVAPPVSAMEHEWTDRLGRVYVYFERGTPQWCQCNHLCVIE